MYTVPNSSTVCIISFMPFDAVVQGTFFLTVLSLYDKFLNITDALKIEVKQISYVLLKF